jgi:hypothetical protein
MLNWVYLQKTTQPYRRKLTEQQSRDLLAEYWRAGSVSSNSESVSQLNLFAVSSLPRFAPGTGQPLQTEEKTIAAKAMGAVMEFICPSKNAEQRAGRAARHEFAAEIIADTVAMLPCTKWWVAGAFRAGFLASEDKGATGAGLDFVQGAALNKVARLAMPGSMMMKRFENIENKVAREMATHATVGTGFGVASTVFRPESWHDRKTGEFSIGAAVQNVGTAGLLGGFINMPAGAIGSRIGKVTLNSALGQKVGLTDAYVLSNVAAGTTGGVIFGGSDAIINGHSLWQGMLTGGFVGGFTGGTVGVVTRPRYQLQPETLGQRPQELRPQELRGQDRTGNDRPIIDKVARGKALEMGVDPETYARLQLDMTTRQIPLEKRIAMLGPAEERTLTTEVQKPGAEKHVGEYKTFGEWADDWLTPFQELARYYHFGPNEVVVPEGYARTLDEVLALRRIVGQDPDSLAGHPEKLAQVAEAQRLLDAHPMKDRAHPVDLIPFLEEVPDRTLVKRLMLMEGHNAADPWHRKTYRPDFVSAASAQDDGTMTYYAQNRDFFSRETAYHEWSHLLEYKVALESGANAAAYEYTRKAWAPSDYAGRDAPETWAEMGASLLHPEADQFLHAAHKAPIRTSIYTSALVKALSAVPPQYKSVFAKQYAQRVAYVQEKILPVAQQELANTFALGGGQDRVRAATMLGMLGNREHYFQLRAAAFKSPDSKVAQAAFDAAFGYVQRGRRGVSNYELTEPTATLDAQATFLAEMGGYGSRSRMHAMDQLNVLRKFNDRATLFHDLYAIGNRKTITGADLAETQRIINHIPDTPGKKIALREALRFTSDPEMKVDMAMAAMEKNPTLHADGLQVLAELGLSRTRPVLEAFARQSTDAQARELAQRGLAKVNKVEAFEQALDGLRSPDAGERQISLMELAQTRNNKAIGPLLEMYLNGPSAQDQRMAARLLENFFTPAMWKFEARKIVEPRRLYGEKLSALMQGRPVYDGE